MSDDESGQNGNPSSNRLTDAYRKLNIEVRNISLQAEVLSICFTESFDFLRGQDAELTEKLTSQIETVFAQHLDTRCEEEVAVLREALNGLLTRPAGA